MRASEFLMEDEIRQKLIKELETKIKDTEEAIDYFQQQNDHESVNTLKHYVADLVVRLNQAKTNSIPNGNNSEGMMLSNGQIHEYVQLDYLIYNRKLKAASDDFIKRVTDGGDSYELVNIVAKEYGISTRLFQNYLDDKNIISDTKTKELVTPDIDGMQASL